MGAWIETQDMVLPAAVSASLLAWERGLKHAVLSVFALGRIVAPGMGAWIETFENQFLSPVGIVAPGMGAWIETMISSIRKSRLIVAPGMGAWIETPRDNGSERERSESLLAWERGLKLQC